MKNFQAFVNYVEEIDFIFIQPLTQNVSKRLKIFDNTLIIEPYLEFGKYQQQ